MKLRVTVSIDTDATDCVFLHLRVFYLRLVSYDYPKSLAYFRRYALTVLDFHYVFVRSITFDEELGKG